ncbi:voltage-dependent anion channel domain-containing protein [Neurospora intermedia]|uniref:Voltage-dependent anion channel domain-containing protein n=1 Tax=Neurospora intermedia TaxID=5142 RepID=A0ABR3DJR5_NEUIN
MMGQSTNMGSQAPMPPPVQTGTHVIIHDTTYNQNQQSPTQYQQQQNRLNPADTSFLGSHSRQSSSATVTGDDSDPSRAYGTYAGTPKGEYEKKGRSTDYLSGPTGDNSLNTSAASSRLALNSNNAKFNHDGHMSGGAGHHHRRSASPSSSSSDSDSDLEGAGGHMQKGHHHVDPYDPSRPKLPLKARLKHFTWAWYTLCMSTGGLSLLIAAQPHTFPGLRQIGMTVYIINIIIFVLLTSLQITRFMLHAGSFKASLTHPREGFFFPTFFLSIATLITSTQKYGTPPDAEPSQDLVWVLHIAFWIYLILATAVAIGQYSFLFSQKRSFSLATMMPTWILPIFPIMLSGTIAAVISPFQPPHRAIVVICAGLTCQGLGAAVAFMMYAHMVGRLMSVGLPDREHRPGLFMCVGPPSFTALAFIGMAQGLPRDFDHDMDGFIDAGMIRTMAVIGAVLLWALAFWWFFIGVLAVLASRPKYFHLGWWASVFPNTGFTLATISIGNAFQSDAVLWVGTGMSLCLLGTYLFVLGNHVRAVVVQDICYPGRDEDVEDH